MFRSSALSLAVAATLAAPAWGQDAPLALRPARELAPPVASAGAQRRALAFDEARGGALLVYRWIVTVGYFAVALAPGAGLVGHLPREYVLAIHLDGDGVVAEHALRHTTVGLDRSLDELLAPPGDAL